MVKVTKKMQKRLGKGWRQVVEQQNNQEQKPFENT
jgi:hypothetical protein